MTDKILDFSAKRKEVIEKKRRSFERVMFNNILGAYSVLDESGTIFPITLIDISYQGCLFEIPKGKDTENIFDKDKELTMRIYFTKGSYLPVMFKIKNKREHQEDGINTLRFGVEFETSAPSFEALRPFIDFLYKFAEHSTVDKGSDKIFFL